MQWYVYLMTASAVLVCGWSSLALFGRPVSLLLDLRRQVFGQLRTFGNAAAPRPRETAVTSRQIREYDEAVRKLRDAERAFRDLGSQLIAFHESEPALCAIMRLFCLDVVTAGKRLNDLAGTYSQASPDRDSLRHDIKIALRIAAPAPYRRGSRSNRLLDYQQRSLHLRDMMSVAAAHSAIGN